jgi:predicted RNA polymerase sigma factor
MLVLLPNVRGDLLEQAGLPAQSRETFTEAAVRTKSESERALLRRRAEMNLTRTPNSP